MTTDKQGNLLSGATVEAAEFFDEAVEAFNTYRGDPVALLDNAIKAAPDFAMAHILKAHLFGLATEPDATSEAKAILCKAKTLRLSDREVSHVAALDLVTEGHWTAAATALDRHNARYPHDLVALQSGHLMDFFRASARGLRDRIAQSSCRNGRPACRATRSCSACMPSGLRRPVTTPGQRRSAGAPCTCNRSTAGPTMRSPT